MFCASARRGAAEFGFVLLVVGLAACANGEKVEFSPTLVGQIAPEQIAAEMNLVAPMVTPALLNECKSHLEAESFLGAKYKVVSELTPNVKASCIAQNRTVGISLIKSNAKAVAFVAQMTKVAGVYGTGHSSKVGGCRFVLTDGEVKFGGLVPERINLDSPCHHISSVDRSTDQQQSQSRRSPTGDEHYADA